jgi:hypothetical protein
MAGNVLMLSEGRRGVDKLYTLRDGESVEPNVGPFIDISGILTLYLDKESYERAGLVGKPDGVKGKRGTKPRWGKTFAVENLLNFSLHLKSCGSQSTPSLNATWQEGI